MVGAQLEGCIELLMEEVDRKTLGNATSKPGGKIIIEYRFNGVILCALNTDSYNYYRGLANKSPKIKYK